MLPGFLYFKPKLSISSRIWIKDTFSRGRVTSLGLHSIFTKVSRLISGFRALSSSSLLASCIWLSCIYIPLFKTLTPPSHWRVRPRGLKRWSWPGRPGCRNPEERRPRRRPGALQGETGASGLSEVTLWSQSRARLALPTWAAFGEIGIPEESQHSLVW